MLLRRSLMTIEKREAAHQADNDLSATLLSLSLSLWAWFFKLRFDLARYLLSLKDAVCIPQLRTLRNQILPVCASLWSTLFSSSLLLFLPLLSEVNQNNVNISQLRVLEKGVSTKLQNTSKRQLDVAMHFVLVPCTDPAQTTLACAASIRQQCSVCTVWCAQCAHTHTHTHTHTSSTAFTCACCNLAYGRCDRVWPSSK